MAMEGQNKISTEPVLSIWDICSEKSRTGKPLLNEPVGSYLGNQARRRRLRLVRGRKRGRDAQKQAILLRQPLSCAVESLSLTTTPSFHKWLHIRIGEALQQKHMVSSLATPPRAHYEGMNGCWPCNRPWSIRLPQLKLFFGNRGVTTQHRNDEHFVRLVRVKWRAHWGVGNPLSKPLMRSSLVKVHAICLEKTIQLPLMQDQKVIQAFSSHTSQKTFTDGIRSRSSKGLDAAGCRHSCKIRTEFPIVIPNQICGCVSIRSCLRSGTCHPGIGRGSGHIHVDPPCAISVR
jgi:hypothetical protein